MFAISGVSLTDLTFIEDGSRDFLEDGSINQKKIDATESLIDDICELQEKALYEFENDDALAEFLTLDLGSEEELFKLSLQRRPRAQ